METNNQTDVQHKTGKESIEAFKALVLLALIAAFIGAQFYFLFTTILAQ